MNAYNLERLVVAGTDTGIGKTVLSALMTLALDGRYWKPVQSGLEEETDSDAVRRMTGLPEERFLPEAYRLARPLSPDQSARYDGVEIDPARLAVPPSDRPLVIECAGGVLVPLNDALMQIDQIVSWNAPVLLAVRSGLGTINHTLLTLEALDRRSIPVVGVVMIGPEHRDNIRSISIRTDVPIVGRLPWLERIDRASLLECYTTGFTPVEEWNMIV